MRYSRTAIIALHRFDLLVPATREAGERTKQALMILPDQAAKDIDPAWFEQSENIRINDDFVVDIMLNACRETYESLELV